jgi:hypothetical protein
MTRVNVLNQQQFYFAPFTEYHISHPAYNYIPFLRGSCAFQIDMIRSADSNLSSVMTNYGYTVSAGEPILSKVISQMAGIAPRSILYKLYDLIRTRKDAKSSPEEINMNLTPVFSELREKIDFAQLVRNKNLGWSIAAFNEFIGRFYKLQ